MSELTLFVFRIAFLVLLWVFVFFVVYAVRSDLFGQRVKRVSPTISRAAAPEAAAFLTQAHSALPSEPLATAGGAGLSLVITAGPKSGEHIVLDEESVTIGRAADSRLMIRDDYTSSRHARLDLRNGTWMLTDLDSTNGTLLDGRRIRTPVAVPLNTPITIGQTVFELRA